MESKNYDPNGLDLHPIVEKKLEELFNDIQIKIVKGNPELEPEFEKLKKSALTLLVCEGVHNDAIVTNAYRVGETLLNTFMSVSLEKYPNFHSSFGKMSVN